MQVQELASAVIKSCGNPTDDELPLDLVVEGVIAAFEHYIRQLNASPQNQTADYFTWNPTAKIENVPGASGENFSKAAFVEIQTDAQRDLWDQIPTTSWEDIDQAEAFGEWKVAFIGNNPVKARFSWDVASNSPTLRVLADVDPQPLSAMSDVPSAIPSRFHPMLADHALMFTALPHLLLGEAKMKRYGAFADMMVPLVSERIRSAEQDFNFFRFENPEQGSAISRPFNAARRTNFRARFPGI